MGFWGTCQSAAHGTCQSDRYRQCMWAHHCTVWFTPEWMGPGTRGYQKGKALKKESVLEVLVCFILFWGTKMRSCCLLDLKWRWSGLSPVGLEICHQSMFLLINLFRDPVGVWDNVQKETCYTTAYQLLYLKNNNKTFIHIGNNFLVYFCLSCASFKIPAVDTGYLYNLCKEFEMSVSGLLIIHESA